VSRYQHDWALLSMLVNPSPDWNEPKEIMHQLYQLDPGNPNYTTGYAFALAQSGKGPAALAIAARLSPADRDFTPRAPYLAYIYGANHMKAEVTRMENLGHDTSLLPEESLLFTLGEQLAERKTPPPPVAPKPKPPAPS
jgi:hypothetical protein